MCVELLQERLIKATVQGLGQRVSMQKGTRIVGWGLCQDLGAGLRTSYTPPEDVPVRGASRMEIQGSLSKSFQGAMRMHQRSPMVVRVPNDSANFQQRDHDIADENIPEDVSIQIAISLPNRTAYHERVLPR